MHELQVRVLKYFETLTDCAMVFAELDWYDHAIPFHDAGLD